MKRLYIVTFGNKTVNQHFNLSTKSPVVYVDQKTDNLIQKGKFFPIMISDSKSDFNFFEKNENMEKLLLFVLGHFERNDAILLALHEKYKEEFLTLLREEKEIKCYISDFSIRAEEKNKEQLYIIKADVDFEAGFAEMMLQPFSLHEEEEAAPKNTFYFDEN
ncbi:hypothetical protein A3A09_00850 [Candidatus Nomurabacteria bacterium RIFCSPLOWO2_01_FULL_42_20]|uniref:Uncharacterized protein n=1 Tax=Candidatus Nomurabacteria bacterium RIFCSPHIGHO2_01_FULL_42_16 TaxID=1801743 RepID=A0A1F6VKF9_9BACT|nr:MAG: hypothetical protein A2824_02080 [Candidatus Nomurabacteria bacterium RIFCSPHIGHO2_01_FULL_42_16]OGI92436.1 MAG: hypothetical protein A3A09_00850 [Candidatus Nomurabacteria bacterium RIFCSPLOWO2_01_FULL_42_20]